MRGLNEKLLTLTLALTFLALLAMTGTSAKPRIIVLANDIDFNLSADFFGFLGNKGMETVRATAADFETYKSEKFIVILGGPDAPDGIGNIVKQILTTQEQNTIRLKDNRMKYVKIDPWGKLSGQRVTILAGSDRNETKKAHEENRDGVAQDAASQGVVPSQASVSIEGFKFTPASITIQKGTTVTWTNLDGASHTSTALDGKWDSKTLGKDNSYSFTFNDTGTFNYKCSFHFTMQGTVTVE